MEAKEILSSRLYSVGVKAVIQRQQTVLVLKVANTEYWELPGMRVDKK